MSYAVITTTTAGVEEYSGERVGTFGVASVTMARPQSDSKGHPRSAIIQCHGAMRGMPVIADARDAFLRQLRAVT